MIAKLVFVYDSSLEPRSVDLHSIMELLDNAQTAGILCERVDTKDLDDGAFQHWREKAQLVGVLQKQAVRQQFGSHRQSGCPYLGKEVPALFVYEKGKAQPVAVYPHKKQREAYSITGYLQSL